MRLLPLAIGVIAGRIEEGRVACPEPGKRDLNIGTRRRGTDCLQCMAAAGDPKRIEKIPKIEVSEQLRDDRGAMSEMA